MLIGSYNLEKRVGRGAVAEVWAGRMASTGEPVAVKIMAGHVDRDEAELDAFFHEVRTVASLSHPGIVQILDYGRSEFEPAGGVVPYLVTELATGGTLGHGWRAGNFADARRVLIAILDALAHAHARGVIHRDLKPGNVLRSEADPNADIKVTDFGIARLAPLGERTQADGFIAGTPPYMAPEQIRGDWRDQGPWTDLYSVGCIAWRLVTGKPLYEGERDEIFARHLTDDLPDFRPSIAVPKGFLDWLRWLLHREIPQRCQRAADAAMELFALELDADPKTVEVSDLPDDTPPPTTLITETSDVPSDLPDRPARRSGNVSDSRELVIRLRQLASPQRAIVSMPVHTELRLWGLRRLPFVGRKVERTKLWSILQATFDADRPQLAKLTGAPGTGKSALARWLVERSHELGLSEPLLVVHDPIQRRDDGLPGALTRWFRLEDLSPAEAVTRLRARLAGHVDDGNAVALAGVLTDWIANPNNKSAGGFEREERATAVLAALRMLSHRRAGLVWIEDGHRATQTLEYLTRALEIAGDDRPNVMFVVTQQDEELATRSGAAEALRQLTQVTNAHEVELEPLPDADVSQFLDAVLPLEREVRDALIERTHGNPLFAVQMLGDWVDRGELEINEDGRLEVHDLSTALPRGLRGVLDRKLTNLAEQVDRDPEDLRRTLELAAAFGQTVRTFEWSVARDKAGLIRLRDFTDTLIRSGLASPAGEDWAFAHDLFREMLIEGAKEGGRWEHWNRTCVETLEDLYPAPDPERIASHQEEAGNWAEAADACLAAAERHFQGRSLESSRRWIDRAASAIEEAGLGADDELRGRRLVGRVRIAQAEGSYEEGISLLDELEAEAREHGWDELLVSAMCRRSGILFLAGAPQASLRAALRAEGAATALGNDKWRFVSLGSAIMGAIAVGDWKSAESWARERLGIAESFSPKLGEGFIRGARTHGGLTLGTVLAQRGVSKEARVLTGKLLKQLPPDDHILHGLALSLKGDVARLKGRAQEARAAYGKALELFENHTYRGDETVLGRLGLLALQDDELDAARDYFDRARAAIDRRRTESDRRFIELAIAVLDGAEDWSQFSDPLDEPIYSREAVELYGWLSARARDAGEDEIADHADERRDIALRALG